MSNIIPISREDDGELLGYVVKDGSSWQALTTFEYAFARTATQQAAEQVVREQGLKVVKGLWQYLDSDDKQWHPCIISEASPRRVTVIRTNAMGYQEPDTYKYVSIKNPTETNLIPG